MSSTQKQAEVNWFSCSTMCLFRSSHCSWFTDFTRKENRVRSREGGIMEEGSRRTGEREEGEERDLFAGLFRP